MNTKHFQVNVLRVENPNGAYAWGAYWFDEDVDDPTAVCGRNPLGIRTFASVEELAEALSEHFDVNFSPSLSRPTAVRHPILGWEELAKPGEVPVYSMTTNRRRKRQPKVWRRHMYIEHYRTKEEGGELYRAALEYWTTPEYPDNRRFLLIPFHTEGDVPSELRELAVEWLRCHYESFQKGAVCAPSLLNRSPTLCLWEIDVLHASKYPRKRAA